MDGAKAAPVPIEMWVKWPLKTSPHRRRLYSPVVRHVKGFLRYLFALICKRIRFLFSDGLKRPARLYSINSVGVNAVSEPGIGILIIDDDLESQLALRYVLDAEDWRVRVVPLVHHGLADLASGDWTLVLVNVALTDMSGPVFEMLKDLAQADAAADDGKKSVRVLFLIPELLAKDAKPVMDRFSLPYVLKPFHLNDFLDKVGDLLIEAQVLKQPIRQIRPEQSASDRRKKDRRTGQDRRTTMFASREDYQMSEEDLLEYERQEQEEQKKRQVKEKQLENL